MDNLIYALLILGITNLGTLLAFSWFIYLENKTKNKMINSLIAKSSQEFINHEMVDKTQSIKVEPQQDIQADLQELGDLTDTDFDKHILDK